MNSKDFPDDVSFKTCPSIASTSSEFSDFEDYIDKSFNVEEYFENLNYSNISSKTLESYLSSIIINYF